MCPDRQGLAIRFPACRWPSAALARRCSSAAQLPQKGSPIGSANRRSECGGARESLAGARTGQGADRPTAPVASSWPAGSGQVHRLASGDGVLVRDCPGSTLVLLRLATRNLKGAWCFLERNQAPAMAIALPTRSRTFELLHHGR